MNATNRQISKSRSIVILHSSLTAVGGAERVAIEEARYFAGRCKTQLLTFRSNPKALLEHEGIPLRIIGGGGATDKGYNSPLSLLRRSISLASALKRAKPDLVISCTTGGLYELFLATMVAPVPYVLHVHGTIFWFPEDVLKYSLVFRHAFNTVRQSVRGHAEFIAPTVRLGLWKRLRTELKAILNYLAVKRAASVLVLSNHMKWEVMQLYRRDAVTLPLILVPQSFIDFHPNASVREELGLSKDDQVVLSVSRLDPRKRLDLLVRSFSRLAEDLDNVVLVIIGEGSEESHLRNLSKELGVGEKVRFPGFVPENQLGKWYSACDVFVYPGWSDFALTIVEALAMGKKVVVSSEMDLDLGITVKGRVFAADPEVHQFADTLRKALTESSTPEFRLEHLNEEKSLEALASLCEEIIASRGGEKSS